jgi:zinc resistance-associated protein
MDGYGYDQRGYYGNLSEQEMQKLDQQRAEFFKATENLRQQLYEKEQDLRSELAKENPDTSKASSLQSEISKLQSELDQKRLDYEIQARKIAPNYNNRGYRGYGPMMGYGPRGGGYCAW